MATRRIAIVISVDGGNKSSTAIRGVAKSSKELDSVVKKMDRGFASLNSSMKRMGPQVRKLSHLQSGLTNSFLLGNIAARAISMTIVNLQRAFSFGVASMIDFEFNMKKVSAITGVTGGNLESLTAKVRLLAQFSPRTSAEIAQTSFEMSKLGLTASEISDSLQGVINLSVALDESANEVGKALVNVKNVFKKDAKEISKVTDTLFSVFGKSALDLNKFSTAFAFAGGAAKIAGISFEELTALMGVLASSGIRASTIGTQLRSILIELSDGSTKAGTAMDNQSIKTIGLTGAMAELAKQELSGIDVKRIFGKRAISVADILLKNIGMYKELKKAQEGSEGATQKAADTLSDTLKVAIKEVTSAYSEMFNVLNDLAGPKLREWAKSFAGWLREAIPNKSIIETGFKTDTKALGGLTKAVQLIAVYKEALLASTKNQYAAEEALNSYNKVFINTFAEMKTEHTEAWHEAEKDIESYIKKIEDLQKEIDKITGIPGFGKHTNIDSLKSAIKTLSVKSKEQDTLTAALKEDAAMQDEHKKSVEAMVAELLRDAKSDVEPFSFGAPDEANLLGLQKLQETLTTLMDKFAESGEVGPSTLKKMFDAYKLVYGAAEELNDKIEENSLNFALLEVTLYNVSSGVDSLISGSITNLAAAITGLKFTTFDFGEMFKNMLVSMASQLTTVLIKMLIFKTLLSAFNIAGTGGFGFVGGNMFQQAALMATGGILGKARGHHGMVNSPTMMLVGEEGPERVDVTPRAKAARGGSSSGPTLNLVVNGNIFNKEQAMGFVNEALEQLDRRTSRV